MPQQSPPPTWLTTILRVPSRDLSYQEKALLLTLSAGTCDTNGDLAEALGTTVTSVASLLMRLRRTGWLTNNPPGSPKRFSPGPLLTTLLTGSAHAPEPFEQWYALYGKHVGSPSVARRAWLALSPTDQLAARAFTPRYVAATAELHFRATPLNFLRDRLWERPLPSPNAPLAPTTPRAGRGAAPTTGVGSGP